MAVTELAWGSVALAGGEEGAKELDPLLALGGSIIGEKDDGHDVEEGGNEVIDGAGVEGERDEPGIKDGVVAGETDGMGDAGDTDGMGDAGDTDGMGDAGETDGMGDAGDIDGMGDAGDTDGMGDAGDTDGMGETGSGPIEGDLEGNALPAMLNM